MAAGHRDASPSIASFNDSISLTPLTATRKNDGTRDETKNEDWRSEWQSDFKWNQNARIRSKSSFRVAKERSGIALVKSFYYVRDRLWPYLKRPNYKKQLPALFLVLAFGVVPFALFASLTNGFAGQSLVFDPDASNFRSTGNLFSKKQQFCQQNFNKTKNDSLSQNPVVGGIENIFVLDNVSTKTYSFSIVKIIDMSWDIVVGRGVQLLASWAAYIVFTNALLRIIELHPVSFDIFRKIALEGPHIASLWALVKEIYKAKSKRIVSLFLYVLLSTTYILSIPPFLSAMTGYDTSTVMWLDSGNSKDMVQVPEWNSSMIWSGTKNTTFEKKACVDPDDLSDLLGARESQFQQCDCQYPNGTIYHANEGYRYGGESTCIFDYPNNTQQYNKEFIHRKPETGYCYSTFDITINGIKYDAANLNKTFGTCFYGVGYTSSEFEASVHCLPDTRDKAYQWGFSSILSGIFVIIHLVWSLSMYAIWQDAQLNSTLAKSNYNMTRLRAAFAVTEATKQKTGLTVKELVQANEEELKQEVYGSKTTSSTALDYKIFSKNQNHEGTEFSYRALSKKDSDTKNTIPYHVASITM